MGLEEEGIYANIERSSLMKISTRPEIFPCSEVIGWILLRENLTTRMPGESAERISRAKDGKGTATGKGRIFREAKDHLGGK